MGKQEKFREKLYRRPTPKNINWADLVSFFESLGFSVSANGTSHYCFIHPESKIKGTISKPHPSNEMKRYQIKDAIEILEQHERQAET